MWCRSWDGAVKEWGLMPVVLFPSQAADEPHDRPDTDKNKLISITRSSQNPLILCFHAYRTFLVWILSVNNLYCQKYDEFESKKNGQGSYRSGKTGKGQGIWVVRESQGKSLKCDKVREKSGKIKIVFRNFSLNVWMMTCCQNTL